MVSKRYFVNGEYKNHREHPSNITGFMILTGDEFEGSLSTGGLKNSAEDLEGFVDEMYGALYFKRSREIGGIEVWELYPEKGEDVGGRYSGRLVELEGRIEGRLGTRASLKSAPDSDYSIEEWDVEITLLEPEN